MNALALLMMLAAAPDGGVSGTGIADSIFMAPPSSDAGVVVYAPFKDPLYSVCPDAPEAQELDGGALLLPPLRATRVSCLMATCEDDRLSRKKGDEIKPPPAWWVTAISAAVLVGAGMFTVGRFTAPATAPPSPGP